MVCVVAQKRRSLTDSLVVPETENRFLQTGLSVSSLGFQWDQNSTGDYSHTYIQMLESSSVTAGTVPRPGLSDRGAIAYRPSGTGELKVNVNAAAEHSESQAGTNHLLRSISACALPPARSIGKHEKNRKEKRQGDTDLARLKHRRSRQAPGDRAPSDGR
jgi:hypothetical protein